MKEKYFALGKCVKFLLGDMFDPKLGGLKFKFQEAKQETDGIMQGYISQSQKQESYYFFL